MLPKKLLEEAPVGPNASGSSFQRMGGRERKTDRSHTSAFTGSGMVLGSTDQSSSSRISLLGNWKQSSNGDAAGAESLTDRREKAKKAALARLDAHKGSGSD